jgi:hypothetical protein
MNKMTLAGAALLATASLGVPMIAWSQSPAPPPPGPGVPDRAGADMPGGPGGRGHDGMRRGWGRWARDVSPQQACMDRVARRAGFVATIGFKLNLTDAQKPLWDKVVAASQTALTNEKQVCAALPDTADARGKQTIIDRMQHMQAMMQARLQGFQQTGPALQALYQALTPEQKAILDHPFRRG